MDRGTTAAARADAPSRPMPNRASACTPATGTRALAAWAAEVNTPEPPMAAAVAMMMVTLTMLAKIEPLTASNRVAGYSSGSTPRSATAAAWYSCM